MVSGYWKKPKTSNKAVTISDGSQFFHFKSFGECAKFLESFTGFKASTIKPLLTKRAEVIVGWKIFYD